MNRILLLSLIALPLVSASLGLSAQGLKDQNQESLANPHPMPPPSDKSKTRPSTDLIDKVHKPKPPSNKQAYHVECELVKKSRKEDKSTWSVAVMATEPSEVSTQSDDMSQKTSFNVTVVPALKDSISVSYRFTMLDGKRTVELAKTNIAMALGTAEKTHLQDSSGNDFELRVTVKRNKN